MEFYDEGYENGYAVGEEDAIDGEYRVSYDDDNPYTGPAAEDYCMGYEQGYEDAFEATYDGTDADEAPEEYDDDEDDERW